MDATTSNVERLAYPIPESCVMLGGISRSSFFELVKNGELKTIKIAGRTLVPRSELERLTRIDTVDREAAA